MGRLIGMRVNALWLVVVVLAAACAGGDVIGVPFTPEPLPLCADVPAITAESHRVSDRIPDAGNEMLVQEVRAWAEAQPGFEAIWIDQDRLITVAFSQDAEQRQRDLDSEFPGAAVAVPVDWTFEELAQLQASLTDRLPPGFVQASGIFENRGVVSILIGPLTDENIAIANEALAGEPVCLEGIDPSMVPEPGPQPQSGDGWRLLADERTGEPYRTGIATDEDTLAELWRQAGVSGPVPSVDFGSEVVVWFGAVYGSSCPNLRLDDVVVDGAILYPVIVDVDASMVCTADANPRAYIVAVERAKLPAGGFTIRLQAEPPPPGVVDQETVVDEDLSTSAR